MKRKERNEEATTLNFVSDSTKIQAPVHISFWGIRLPVLLLLYSVGSNKYNWKWHFRAALWFFAGLIRDWHLLVLNTSSWRSHLAQEETCKETSTYLWILFFIFSSFCVKRKAARLEVFRKLWQIQSSLIRHHHTIPVFLLLRKTKSPLQQTILWGLDLLWPGQWKLTQDWGQQPDSSLSLQCPKGKNISIFFKSN